MEQLIYFLRNLGETFTRHAQEIEYRYEILQKTMKEEEQLNKEIAAIEKEREIDIPEFLAITKKYKYAAGIGGGVGFAKQELSFNMGKAVDALIEADQQIKEAIKTITQEPETYRDKVLEGDIEAIKRIAALCAALAGKIEAQETAKEQQE